MSVRWTQYPTTSGSFDGVEWWGQIEGEPPATLVVEILFLAIVRVSLHYYDGRGAGPNLLARKQVNLELAEAVAADFRARAEAYIVEAKL